MLRGDGVLADQVGKQVLGAGAVGSDHCAPLVRVLVELAVGVSRQHLGLFGFAGQGLVELALGRDVLDLFGHRHAAQHVGEHVTQGKRSGAHLAHALRVLGPGALFALEAGLLGVGHAERAGLFVLADTLNPAGSRLAVVGLVHVLTQRRAADQRDYRVTPERWAPVDDRDALHGLHGLQAQLHAPLHSHQDVGGLFLKVFRDNIGGREEVGELQRLVDVLRRQAEHWLDG